MSGRCGGGASGPIACTRPERRESVLADLATQNTCLNAAEEIERESGCVPGQKFRMRTHAHCIGHQAALLTKPPALACSDLATTIVRLGHVLSGSTQMRAFATALDREMEVNYEHREVLILPPEVQEW